MRAAFRSFAQMFQAHRLPAISRHVSAHPGHVKVHLRLSESFCSHAPRTIPLPDSQLTMEPVRSRLDALLPFLETEVVQGRWPAEKSLEQSSPVDRMLIQPLVRDLNLSVKSVYRLISFICSLDDQLLLTCEVCGVRNSASEVRLELLNPSRVITDLYDPLSHLGVRQPQKLLAQCPALLLASAVPSLTPTDSWNGPIPRRATLLMEALDELGSLLSRNDLTALLTRFPAVLLRPRHELFQMYTYLTENMGLQSTDLVRSTQMRAHRHFLRNTTGLRLVSCPAWCLPLGRVRARHLLAVLAGCWPPGRSTLQGTTGDQRLAKLLTVPAQQVSRWLGLFSPNNEQSTDESDPRTKSSDSSNTINLTGADVQAFESLISQVKFDSEEHAVDDRASDSLQSPKQSLFTTLDLLETTPYDTSDED